MRPNEVVVDAPALLLSFALPGSHKSSGVCWRLSLLGAGAVAPWRLLPSTLQWLGIASFDVPREVVGSRVHPRTRMLARDRKKARDRNLGVRGTQFS